MSEEFKFYLAFMVIVFLFILLISHVTKRTELERCMDKCIQHNVDNNCIDKCFEYYDKKID